MLNNLNYHTGNIILNKVQAHFSINSTGSNNWVECEPIRHTTRPRLRIQIEWKHLSQLTPLGNRQWKFCNKRR